MRLTSTQLVTTHFSYPDLNVIYHIKCIFGWDSATEQSWGSSASDGTHLLGSCTGQGPFRELMDDLTARAKSVPFIHQQKSPQYNYACFFYGR